MASLDHNYALVVFLIILGVAAGALVLYAVCHFFFSEAKSKESMSNEQVEYLREVKARNVRELAGSVGRRDIYDDLNSRLHRNV